MKRLNFHFTGLPFVVAVTVAGVLCACPGGDGGDGWDGGDESPDAGSDETMVTTDLFGTVVDDADGTPLSGVEVSAPAGSSTKTEADGTFVLEGVTAPRSRCAVVARRDGYFVAGKATVPVSGGATRLRLRLVKKVPQTVDPSGGTVSLAGGGGVEFSAGSFAQYGIPVDQPVQVSARHLDPTAADFAAQFPGDPAATRGDGSAAMLVSYGVVQVEMSDEIGTPVELADGKQASLTFPVPASMKGAAPATIPLWHFDEVAGIWKEEGSATLQGDQYVGQVAHFTAWNADKPEATAFVTGTVSCNGKPIEGVTVFAGPSSGATLADGSFRIPVPANTPITVSILNDDIIRSSVTRQAGPIPAGQTESVGEMALDTCPAHLTGHVVLADGKSVGATVLVTWDGGAGHGYAPAGNLSAEAPPDTDVTVTVTAKGGAVSTTVTKKTPPAGEQMDLGTLVVAVDTSCTFWDVDAKAYKAALSPTGDVLAVSGYNVKAVELRDAATGAVAHTLATQASHLQFNADGTRLLVGNLLGGVPTVWDATTGASLRTFPAELDSAWLTSDGASILGLGLLHKVSQYAVADGTVMRTFAVANTDAIGVMGTRAAGQQLMILNSNSGDMSVTVWDVATDKLARTIAVGRTLSMGGQMYERSADGGTVAFHRNFGGPSDDHGVDFFDTGTGQKVNAQPLRNSASSSYASALAIAPDGTGFVTQQVLASGDYGPIVLHALPSLAASRTLPWPENTRVDELVFSGDGRFLAAVEHDGFVRIVDVSSCQ